MAENNRVPIVHEKQTERIAQLPRARQQVGMDMLDGLLTQRGR